MIARRYGSLLFTASLASLFGIPKVSACTAAKTAHVGLVRTLAVELSASGGRVHAIAPGWIHSDMSPKRSTAILRAKQKFSDARH